jgi:DNA-binding transcriptional LysR family regulator
MGQLENLEVFIRVVEAGGITKAADQLGIAKSAVSRRLSELESHLQVKLLQRTTRRFHLTELGRSFYEQSKLVVKSYQELEESVTQESQTLKGGLTLSIPLSFGVRYFHKALTAFRFLHPNIELKVELSDHEINMLEQMTAVAFRIGNLDDSSLQARRILPIQFVLCVAPSYLKSHPVNKLSDLGGVNFLHYSLQESQKLKATRADEEEVVKLKSDITSNNGDFLLEMAIAGHGFVLLPEFLCFKAIREGSLVSVLNDYSFSAMSAYAVYPRNRFLSKNARAFIDFLVDFYQPPYDWQLNK